MFSVENYTMDRAERCIKRDVRNGKNLIIGIYKKQYAEPYTRITHMANTTQWLLPGNRSGCPHTVSSLPLGERTEEFPRADESPRLTRENSISLKVSIVQYDLFF